MEWVTPPITNRGVECTEEEHLSALVDWCQITVWNLTPEDIAGKLLRIPYFLMSNDFRGGLQGGYQGLMCFDEIRVFEPTNERVERGYQIVMAGKGCRNYEKFLEANEETWYDFFARALEFEVNFPRIDIAIDDRKTYFEISELIALSLEGRAVSRSRLASSIGAFTLANGERKGNTLNIGSRQSEFFMTFYEKGYEQAEKIGIVEDEEIPNWNRYELKFRQKRAVRLVEELVRRKEIFTVAMEVLNDNIRFVEKAEKSKDTNRRRYAMWQPWAEFMRDVGKLKLTMKPEYKDYYQRLEWIGRSVAPTLKVYKMIDEALGTNFVDEIIENAVLTKKHVQMLEDYLKQIQAEVTLAQKRAKDFQAESMRAAKEMIAERIAEMQDRGWESAPLAIPFA